VSTEYLVEAVHRQGMRFECTAGTHSVTLDYPVKADDDGVGPRPLEMLLGSLTACVGGGMVALLRRSGQSFDAFTVRARACRREEHPTVFTEIGLELLFRGAVDGEVVEHCLAQAEQICPVLVMLRAGTPITISYRIAQEMSPS